MTGLDPWDVQVNIHRIDAGFPPSGFEGVRVPVTYKENTWDSTLNPP